jgi:DeoR/GlpR family transcriptional regulator of sugar metabolism
MLSARVRARTDTNGHERALTFVGFDGNLSIMLARQRQAIILERVREEGAVRVADLVRELGVSDMTIRRDLEILHDQGVLEKVHGGATALPGSALFEPGFAVKASLQQAEKDAIADAAAALVEPGMAVAVSAGTTTYALARRLAEIPGLTVVTNSIRVADVLDQVGRADQTTILTGGVRTPTDALVGPFAVAANRTVHVDLVFVGVHGMDPKSGFTCPNLLEADTDRALIEAGRRLVVVTDHSKWGVIGISSIARLDQADVLITDAGLVPEARETLEEHVRQLVIVDPTADEVPVDRAV